MHLYIGHMQEKIQQIQAEIDSFQIQSEELKEQFRLTFLSKKGSISLLFEAFRSMPAEEKKLYGQPLNVLKKNAEEKWKNADFSKESAGPTGYDFTRPSGINHPGSIHPLNLVKNELIQVFSGLGFEVATGPEVEGDWYNFTALNIPEDHPARDMQDTFFVQTNPAIVLRTHTSPVQVRTMLSQKPPIRIIAPGRVYRNDSDATHSPIFHQIEGLYIAPKTSFSDLKQVLFYFVKEVFGEDVNIRFRPSFFPFTEPSAEMDIEWVKNGEKKWMEILGCGMVDPNVLIQCGIDPEEYSGYAFGLGVERICMLKYGISDIRLFLENDLRFLQQFSSETLD